LNPITLSLIPGPSRASTDLLDFHETFIPVAIHAFIGMLRVLAHHHKWNIHQLDVSNDFLHAMLTQPPGYDVPSKAHYVYKLQISLYGLEQAYQGHASTLVLRSFSIICNSK